MYVSLGLLGKVVLKIVPPAWGSHGSGFWYLHGLDAEGQLRNLIYESAEPWQQTGSDVTFAFSLDPKPLTVL